ncbi:SLBB domain-containing protein [Desulfovibrio sp. OttesenSCG-928-C06]|nr:SLBB domain-containing protein [Desulfovibrio sp. OttesenSCG-928-C06]
MNKDAFIAAVRAAGIVGEGGAGFPAHVKYAASADTVIANGCECEPLLHSDHHVMLHYAPAVCVALRALADAVGASRAVLALKRKHSDLIPLLQREAANSGLELFLLDDFYPAGDEQILVREVTGRSVPPLGIPLNVGVVVANVATLADVGAALGHASGAGGAAMTMKTLTVTGAARRPSVLRAPLGTPLRECLEACGGAIPHEPVFIVGGPMMGRVIGGVDALEREVVTKTTGGLIVLPHGHPLHLNATRETAVLRKRAASACIQCRACSDLCPRGLIGHPFETHRVMRAFAAGVELETANGAQAMICSECGVCEQYACPMGMSPRRINQAVKAAMRQNGLKYEGPREVCEDATRWRDYRKVPVKRLAARLGIADWLAMQTPCLGELEPLEVRIPLRQHIGAAAVPVVQAGQQVAAGDLIGEIPEGALGARIHASISGVVTEVTDFVRIRRA